MEKIFNIKKNLAEKNNQGFTLIELLVVVVIIGILASIITVVLNQAREKAKVARAKVETQQIIKAAELVFQDYGYYPNDSHGTITCPKDIIVDQATGKKWESYINVCNDPWGNPYEWDNQCGNGRTRKPHAPFNSSCLSYSDADSGAIGVTVVGSNNINESCTGDDLCIGSRGHITYGWDGQVVGGGPTCVNNISDCSGLSSFGCVSRTGCALEGYSCSGTVACSSYNADQSSCTNSGCSFSAASCGGNYLCSQWNRTNSSTCTIGHSCIWKNSNKTCNGGFKSCSAFSQSSCTPTGCSWSSSSCSGSPSCSSFSNQSSCQGQPSCIWNSGTCAGSAISCASLGDQNSCTAQSGCSWQ